MIQMYQQELLNKVFDLIQSFAMLNDSLKIDLVHYESL